MKNKKQATRPTTPTAQQQLDFILKLLMWPQGDIALGGPNDDGSSCRDKGSEWYLSYKAKTASGFCGCVYAPTRDAVIAKAMQLYAAQVKTAKMLKDAAK